MTRQEAQQFAARWLPAWTGNDPDRLVRFYSADAFYSDPGTPNGVRGRAELTEYFRRLLAKNPAWVWTQIEAIPMEHGFLNKWKAVIPTGGEAVECVGVCLVQFDAAGLIARNEVYFDRSELLKAMVRAAAQKR